VTRGEAGLFSYHPSKRIGSKKAAKGNQERVEVRESMKGLAMNLRVERVCSKWTRLAASAGNAFGRWVTSLDGLGFTSEDLQSGVQGFGLTGEDVVFGAGDFLLSNRVGGNWASQCRGGS
jgi:hypothetical protein